MKLIELPRLSSKPKSAYIQPLSLLLAAILLVMAVAQLFKYEAFPEVLAAIGVRGWENLAAALIVIMEVAALTFLLYMQLGHVPRVLSMVAGWGVVSVWVILLLLATVENAKNSGLLGATVEVPAGWGSVFFALSLAVLVAWVGWGMWPGRSKKG